MKNVRLFAVAAAMGMFASTVAAAEPVTKDAYVATWGNVDEIIKVDVGDKVVLPTAEIKVVKETRTTDAEYALGADSLGLVDSTICYKGFTNEEGKDTNDDYYSDAKMLFATNDIGVNNWLVSDVKFFSSAKTALYYAGLTNGSDVTSGRFLAPGAAKKTVYALQYANKHLADEAAVLAFFQEEGIINIVEDEDGYISYIDINTTEVTDAKGKVIGTAAKRVFTKNTRYSDDEMKAAVVKGLLTGAIVATDDFGVKYVTTRNYTVAEETAAEDLTYKFSLDGGKTYAGTVAANEILIVKEDRYGNLVPVGATTSDLPGAQDTEVKPVAEKIVVALDASTKTETQYVKYMTITPATPKKYTAVSEYKWNEESGSFDKVAVGATDGLAGLEGFYWAHEYDEEATPAVTTPAEVDGTKLDFIPNTYGLVKLETPANTSDKIVIYTTDINITGINTKTGTMTISASGKDMNVSAVKLDGVWYPAVNNEAELTKVMSYVLGLDTLAGDTTNDTEGEAFDLWAAKYEAAAKDPRTGWELVERTNEKGEKETYTPANSLQHYSGMFCTYKVADGAEVAATVTGNVDAIDTTEAGIKTLTLTAKVGEEVVGTKEVKVVVAPKYERVYKNGKVVKLTAKWLNGNTYAVYSYDWAAKTYTATFYQQDGVTVAATSNGTL